MSKNGDKGVKSNRDRDGDGDGGRDYSFGLERFHLFNLLFSHKKIPDPVNIAHFTHFFYLRNTFLSLHEILPKTVKTSETRQHKNQRTVGLVYSVALCRIEFNSDN